MHAYTIRNDVHYNTKFHLVRVILRMSYQSGNGWQYTPFRMGCFRVYTPMRNYSINVLCHGRNYTKLGHQLVYHDCRQAMSTPPGSLGYLCNIGVEPTTNCNSNETYVILFQIQSCITYLKSRGISGVEHGFPGQYRIPHEII